MTWEHAFDLSTLEAVLYRNVITHGDAKVMAQCRQSWNPLFLHRILQNKSETCVCVVFTRLESQPREAPRRSTQSLALDLGLRNLYVYNTCEYKTQVQRSV